MALKSHALVFSLFRPVYREGDRLAPSEVPVPPDLRDRIKLVLAFYAVPFRQDKHGKLWISSKTALDLDLMWNYTSKAEDPEWLTRHALASNPDDGR
jgi:hypothetical protein